MDWDLLRTFGAVARHGSLTAAARYLGISQSTASRHVQQLEQVAGSPLIIRGAPLQLTDRGEAVCRALGPMMEAALSVAGALETQPELAGAVTVTTVGEVVRWILTPALSTFYATYPRLELRLLADNHIASLAAGEADVALRFVKPTRGDLVTRKLRTESYGLYISRDLVPHETTPWLGLAGSLSALAEQLYTRQTFANRSPRLLVEDLESLTIAVHAGLGVAALPTSVAHSIGTLVQVKPSQVGGRAGGSIPTRGLWRVMHQSRYRLPKVRAVVSWLDEVFSQPTHGPKPPAVNAVATKP